MTTVEKSSTTAFAGLDVVPSGDPALAKDPSSMTPRKVRMAFLAREQAEGAGARVRRSIGTPNLRNFSPFLMLDHFKVSKGAGFPDHPHRGQETITYMLKGKTDHEDFAGNKGTLEPGDLQFMTAGRGIVHAEMPRHEQDENGEWPPVEGMQLWVDLPKSLKKCEPRYRDLKAAEVPSTTVDNGQVTVKIISGKVGEVESLKELAYTPVWLLDVNIKPGGVFRQPIPKGWNSFAYVINGFVNIQGASGNKTEVPTFHNAVLEREGDGVVIANDAGSEEDAHVVLVAGLVLDQKIVQYGPFVLNSQEEVHQALSDYQSYSNGFERAADWESEIGKRMRH